MAEDIGALFNRHDYRLRNLETKVTDVGVSSFNGSTGAITGVSSFNGNVGAVTGVSSLNGATGDIITDNWETYTPTLTNVTLNSGTIVSRYTQTNKTVHVYGKVLFASDTTISGNPSVSLPVTAADAAQQGFSSVIRSGAANFVGIGIINSTSDFFITVLSTAAAYAGRAAISASVPGTWTTSDYFTWSFTYEAA